jgi:hypothetical protein
MRCKWRSEEGGKKRRECQSNLYNERNISDLQRSLSSNSINSIDLKGIKDLRVTVCVSQRRGEKSKGEQRRAEESRAEDSKGEKRRGEQRRGEERSRGRGETCWNVDWQLGDT